MKIKALSFFIFLMIALHGWAQFTPMQKVKINSEAMDIVTKYRENINLYGGEGTAEERDYFRKGIIDLFISDGTFVFNDLDPTGQTSPEHTISTYLDNMDIWYEVGGVKTTITDKDILDIGEPKKSPGGDYWIVECTVKKTVAGTYMKKKPHRTTFELVFIISFKEQGSTVMDFKIAGLRKKSVPVDVQIATEPDGAAVMIDNQPAGKTPYTGSLVEGKHYYKLEKVLYYPNEGDFTLSTSEGKKTLNLKMKPNHGFAQIGTMPEVALPLPLTE